MRDIASTATGDQDLSQRLASLLDNQHTQIWVQLRTTDRGKESGWPAADDKNAGFGRKLRGHKVTAADLPGTAIVSANGDCGLPSSIHSSRDFSRASILWRSEVPRDQQNPYQNEWDALVEAIHDDMPFNEAKRGAEASMVCNMGRMAAHTGREITWEEMLNCEHEFAPGVADLTLDSDSPLMPDEHGRVVVSSTPVEVPISVARYLAVLPAGKVFE